MIRSLPRLALAGLGGAALALSLTGCFGSIDTTGAVPVEETPSTIPAFELALDAERIVEEQGVLVTMDCGDGDIPFVVGTTVECSAFDSSISESRSYTVTITSIDGARYSLDVVGPAAEPSPSEPASAIEPIDAFTAFVVDTLTPVLGEQPLVDCGTEDIEIFIGQEVRCSYETSDNSAFIIVTVSLFDGESYGIDIVEE